MIFKVRTATQRKKSSIVGDIVCMYLLMKEWVLVMANASNYERHFFGRVSLRYSFRFNIMQWNHFCIVHSESSKIMAIVR